MNRFRGFYQFLTNKKVLRTFLASLENLVNNFLCTESINKISEFILLQTKKYVTIAPGNLFGINNKVRVHFQAVSCFAEFFWTLGLSSGASRLVDSELSSKLLLEPAVAERDSSLEPPHSEEEFSF